MSTSRRERWAILKRNQTVSLADAEVMDVRGLSELRDAIAKASSLATQLVTTLPKVQAAIVRERIVGPLRDALGVAQRLK